MPSWATIPAPRQLDGVSPSQTESAKTKRRRVNIRVSHLQHSDVYSVLLDGRLACVRCVRRVRGNCPNFFSASPRKGKPGTAVSVIVNNGAAIP